MAGLVFNNPWSCNLVAHGRTETLVTITKKVGALLLLLTVGSLVGILTFALFLQRTALDFVYVAAASNEDRVLQQLYVNSIMIHDGHEDIRGPQQELIRTFDTLLDRLQNGAPNPSHLTPADFMERLPNVASITGNTFGSGPEVLLLVMDLLPRPPDDLRDKILRLRSEWLRLKDGFSGDNSELIKERMPAISQASRELAAAAGARLIQKRQTMLTTLASIAGLSIMVFVTGLVLTRKFNAMADQVQLLLGRYRELFENANDFVYTTDLDGRFLTVNRAGEAISGYSREELLQKTFSDLMPPADAELWRQKQQESLSEIHIVSKDEKRISLEDSRRPIYENGIVTGIQGVARDVTERNRLKEKLDLARKVEAVGRLAGGIAHDFGNVLTIITGYCTLIHKSLKPDDPLQAEVEGIQKASQRAIAMIRQLLIFSRGQTYVPKVIAADKAISEMTSALRRLIGDNIELTTRVALPLGHINMDPAQFEQILVNLVLNARDAMSAGGKIRIEARNEDVSPAEMNTDEALTPGPYIRFKVSDTGCGMTPEVLSRMFEPFFSTKTQGTGLGLSGVYAIVRQAGGQISAESQPGNGTTVTIYLPRVLEVPASTPAPVLPAGTPS
jgi:PAS domain S-box-containing protein